MKYVKQVLFYMFRHFFRVILPVLPSAILLGLFYRQTRTLVFIRDFGQSDSTSIADIFGMLFIGNVWYYVLLLPVFFVSVSFSCSYLVTMVYKHFRMGKLSVRMPLSNVNHGLESVMPAIGTLMLVLLLYKALFGCFVSLISEVFLSGGAPGGGTIAVVALLGIVSYVFVIYLLMYPMIGVSLSLVYGYSFKDAVGEALRVSGNKHFASLVAGYFFPFFINAVVLYILMAFDAPYAVVALINVFLQLFVITYVTLLSLISVFNQQKLERIDLKKLY